MSLTGAFRWNAICIDCAPNEFDAVVSFYVGLLGLEIAEREPRWAALRSRSGGLGINVQAEDWYVAPLWPEDGPARSKMMHMEIEVDDVAAATADAIALGATQAEPQPADRGPTTLRVLLDPAGHPFCLWS